MNSWQLSKVGAMGAMLGLMMCVGAMAQMPGGGGGQMPPNQQSPMPQQPNGPGNPTDNLPGVQGNSMPSFADQAFVRKTLEDNQA